ncbi:MAG: UDP-glucose 4-epimerase GalE, partial [Meiothermus sp.]
MNVLVTGGAGYIGSHTAKALHRAGFTPIVLDNLSMGHAWAVKWGPLVQADLADRGALFSAMRAHRVEAVIHFAANAYVGESMQNPAQYFRNNVTGTLNLLEAMQEAGVRHMVFSSSCATYGIPQELPIPEEHPQQPINPYGESKLMGERLLRWFGECHGLGWVALRYFNAAGADPEGDLGEEHQPETHLIPLVIGAALGVRGPVRVFGTDYPTPDGTAIRDYIHVSDLAQAHVRALEYLVQGGASQAFNLGTGVGHSVLEVIQTVKRLGGRQVPFEEAPRRPGD